MDGDHVIDAGESIGGGIAAHALIIDTIAITVLIEQPLEGVRVIGGNDAGREAVTKGDYYRPPVFYGGLGGTLSGRGAFFLMRGFRFRAAGGEEQTGCQNESRSPRFHITKLTCLLLRYASSLKPSKAPPAGSRSSAM